MGANQMTLLDDPVVTPRTLDASKSAFGPPSMFVLAASASVGWTAPAPASIETHDGPAWLNRVARRLAACTAPQETEDGTWRTGASPELIRNAVQVLATIVDESSPAPNVIYSADGTIIYSWHSGGWDVEVEVDGEATEAWALERSTGRELTGTADHFELDLRSFIANLDRGA